MPAESKLTSFSGHLSFSTHLPVRDAKEDANRASFEGECAADHDDLIITAYGQTDQ